MPDSTVPDKRAPAIYPMPLTDCIDLLGRTLGQTIANAHGQEVFDTVERIRRLSKASQSADGDQHRQLIDLLATLDPATLLIVARAFSQFLNQANIAEQLYSTLDDSDPLTQQLSSLTTQIKALQNSNIDADAILAAIKQLRIELVLTAHPTEITRRTLIYKQHLIHQCLHDLVQEAPDSPARPALQERLRQLLTQWWHTDEIRSEKPSPVDEAKWGFAVIENSLWDAVPAYLNQLITEVADTLTVTLPLDYCPVHFTSWMGGDRDGNPFVTAEVSREVLLLSRWQAADLFLNDIEQLFNELSMTTCTDELRALAGDQQEPYRAVLRDLRTLLNTTLKHLKARLDQQSPEDASVLETHVLETRILENQEQLWQPLHACYQSLHQCGMGIIADGLLRDTLHRVNCFGVHLTRLDIRQDSSRHTEVLAELVAYLELGDYDQWSEAERVAFLTAELNSKRALLPPQWQPSAGVQEVLDTFYMIAEQPKAALGAYIISMARQASDVLAVQLLLTKTGCPYTLDIAPLFETLDDLNRAPEVMQALLAVAPYRDYIGCNRDQPRQMVMIGYSDSAKDAGVMAASWAQYRAQETLLDVCAAADVSLTLFHGRGGSIGRGGAPTHAALLSQPPGSLANGLRVTEQGEMIRFKLGLPETARTSLGLYTNAILQSNLAPPPTPQPQWRAAMDSLSDISAGAYRQLVRGAEDFIGYFHSATPVNELAKLPLGSRPAKRKTDGGVESLRAIPWIFAWSQNRLMLPAWLGAGEAVEAVVKQGDQDTLETMRATWPFFSTRLSMLEMVYAKADRPLSAHYDEQLVEPGHQPLGQALRERLGRDIDCVLSLTQDKELMQDLPWIGQAVSLRNTYIDPLNLLQVELLSRTRRQPDPVLENALMVTIAGIAAGMRNTG